MDPALPPPEHETEPASGPVAVGLAAGGGAAGLGDAVAVAGLGDAVALTETGDVVALAMPAGVKLAGTAEGDRPAEPDPAPQAQITTTALASTAFDLISSG